jgi:hypothetical protein
MHMISLFSNRIRSLYRHCGIYISNQEFSSFEVLSQGQSFWLWAWEYLFLMLYNNWLWLQRASYSLEESKREGYHASLYKHKISLRLGAPLQVGPYDRSSMQIQNPRLLGYAGF